MQVARVSRHRDDSLAIGRRPDFMIRPLPLKPVSVRVKLAPDLSDSHRPQAKSQATQDGVSAINEESESASWPNRARHLIRHGIPDFCSGLRILFGARIDAAALEER